MLIIQCPHCGSSSAKSREEVYNAGTSHYSGRSSSCGLSFGLSKKPRPRAWFGRGSSRGKRQSVKVQQAERFPFYPGLLIAGFIHITHDQVLPYSEGELWGIAAAAVLSLSACFSLYRFLTEWMCNRCGYTFTPKTVGEIDDRSRQ